LDFVFEVLMWVSFRPMGELWSFNVGGSDIPVGTSSLAGSQS
jgi:hypothetical protein